jgi:hypothetical protein
MHVRIAKLILGVCVLSGAVWAADNPFVGTWKLNLAKSKYNPGKPPKSQNIRVDVEGDGVKDTIDTSDAEGKAFNFSYVAKYDGKDYPISGTPPNGYESVALKRIGDHTLETTYKRGGQVVFTGKTALSKNGKVWTTTQTGTYPDGRQFNNTVVRNKQ